MAGNVKVFMLMAALTALVMALGWMLGGQGGALIALLIAGGMNFFSYWNSDKMVLRQQGAVELSPRQGAELYELTCLFHIRTIIHKQIANEQSIPTT